MCSITCALFKYLRRLPLALLVPVQGERGERLGAPLLHHPAPQVRVAAQRVQHAGDELAHVGALRFAQGHQGRRHAQVGNGL